jgi:hypothetical protein
MPALFRRHRSNLIAIPGNLNYAFDCGFQLGVAFGRLMAPLLFVAGPLPAE